MRKVIKEEWEKVENEFPQHEYGKELYDYIVEMVEEIEENWDDYEGETAKDKVMDYLENVRTSPSYFEQELFDGIVSDLYYSWDDFAKDVAKCIDEPKKIYESRRIQNKKFVNEEFIVGVGEIKLKKSFKDGDKEIGFFGKLGWNDAMTFSKKNSEGWKLPNIEEAKDMVKNYKDVMEKMCRKVDFVIWTNVEDEDNFYRKYNAYGVDFLGRAHSFHEKAEKNYVFCIKDSKENEDLKESKKVYESRRIKNRKFMKESLDIKTYNGLRKCFERIDDDGARHASSGNWEIGLGGYDTGYVVKYKDEEIFRVNYGLKQYEVLSDRLDKKEIERIKEILEVTNEFKDYIDLISTKFINIYDMEFEEENDEIYDELLDKKISYDELYLDNSADEEEVRKELIDYIEKNYDVVITDINFDVEVDY